MNSPSQTEQKTPRAKRTPLKSGAASKTVGTISESDYFRILDGTDLVSIALNRCDCIVEQRRIINESPESVKPDLESSVSFHNSPDSSGTNVFVIQNLAYSATVEGEMAVVIACQFQLQYRAAEAFTDEFFEVFKDGPLLTQAVPFLREFVQSMSLRMGLPPITLPLFKSNAPRPSQKATTP